MSNNKNYWNVARIKGRLIISMKILNIVLIVLFCMCESIAFAEIQKEQQRIECTQWYTNWGDMDVYEIMRYNEKGLRTSHVALLNNRVIESSYMLYYGDKIVTYDIEGKLSSIIETAGNKETRYYYFNGSPSSKTECILQKDKTRYIHYRSDNVIDEMYDEIILENNRKLIRWFDPENEEVVREEMIIEKYDKNGLLVYRESTEFSVNGVTANIKEYSYDVVYDEKERPVLIKRFALDNGEKKLIYSRRIEYADKEFE